MLPPTLPNVQLDLTGVVQEPNSLQIALLVIQGITVLLDQSILLIVHLELTETPLGLPHNLIVLFARQVSIVELLPLLQSLVLLARTGLILLE